MVVFKALTSCHRLDSMEEGRDRSARLDKNSPLLPSFTGSSAPALQSESCAEPSFQVKWFWLLWTLNGLRHDQPMRHAIGRPAQQWSRDHVPRDPRQRAFPRIGRL
ncbi:hypothetical protein J6590_003760 [Homalodisca vitripennis]|nr:hypothetical protein J6590_003760 [Homalodisca vitripennis]